MSYAIFRCKSINTLENLSHIGSHNKREKDSCKPSDLIEISKDTDKEIEVNDFIKEETLEKEYEYFD